VNLSTSVFWNWLLLIIYLCFTSVCSERVLGVCADGSDGSDVRAERVIQTQEEGSFLAVALPAVKAADTVYYVCKI
jgi:hypothetical protein